LDVAKVKVTFTLFVADSVMRKTAFVVDAEGPSTTVTSLIVSPGAKVMKLVDDVAHTVPKLFDT